MVATYWIIGIVSTLLALALAGLEWRSFRRAGKLTRKATWYVKRLGFGVVFLALAYVGVVLLVAAIQTGRSDQTQDVAEQERLCASTKISCHPDISPSESAVTLSQFESSYAAWEAGAEKGQLASRPNYSGLSMLMPDRLKADEFSTGQDLKLDKVEAQKNPSETSYYFDFMLIIALLFGVVPAAAYDYRSARGPSLERWQKEAIRSGLQDSHEAYNKFMISSTRAARREVWIAPAIYTVAGCFFFQFGHVLALTGQSIAIYLLSGVFMQPVMLWAIIVFNRDHASNVWHHTRSGAQDRRFVRPPPAAPKADKSHGSARHAAADDLHAKGFAEREEGNAPPTPRRARTVEEAEAVLAAFKVSLNRKQRAVFEMATVPEQAAMMRQHGFID